MSQQFMDALLRITDALEMAARHSHTTGEVYNLFVFLLVVFAILMLGVVVRWH